MTDSVVPSSAALGRLSHAHDQVVSNLQLRSLGVPETTIRDRCRPGGRWQRPLPRVVVLHSGPLTDEQRLRAALCYAAGRERPVRGGPAPALLTGRAALRLYAVRAVSGHRDPEVDVLIPYARNVRSRSWVRVHRSCRFPHPVVLNGCLPAVPLVRAAVDAIRLNGADPSWRRTLLHELVQARRVTPLALAAELRAQHLTRRPGMTSVLDELGAGTRSPAEGQARAVIEGADLPAPLWNPRLCLDGRFLADPDAYWPRYGVMLEVDSAAHHHAVADWEAGMARHNRLDSLGLVVLHISPHQLKTQPEALIAAVRQALATGPHGPLERITVRPRSF